MKIKFQERIEIIKTAIGFTLIMLSILITLSFISFYVYWKIDQNKIFNSNITVNNLIGNLGAFLGDFFIQKKIGLSSFIIPITLFLIGTQILINKKIITTWKYVLNSLFIIIWLPIFFGFFQSNNFIFSGIYGFEITEYLKKNIGEIGTIFLLIISLLIYIIFKFKISAKKIKKNIYLFYLKYKNIKKKYYEYKKKIKKNTETYLNNFQKKKKHL